MNDYEYGPKYPAGEIIFIEEIGWSMVLLVAWKKDRWVYTIKQTDSEEQFEVEEWQILV